MLLVELHHYIAQILLVVPPLNAVAGVRKSFTLLVYVVITFKSAPEFLLCFGVWKSMVSGRMSF